MQLYGLTKCSTCQKAIAWLKDKGVDHTFVDYRDQPLAPDDLRAHAQALGGWEKLVNRASMTWRQLSEQQRQASTDQEWLALIAQYPALVRRPLTVFADGSVLTGFNEKRFLDKLDLA